MGEPSVMGLYWCATCGALVPWGNVHVCAAGSGTSMGHVGPLYADLERMRRQRDHARAMTTWWKKIALERLDAGPPALAPEDDDGWRP